MTTSEQSIRQLIADGKAVLGIELGSTRIKAVLIDEDHAPIASGNHQWENRFENGVWTYSLDEVWAGLQNSFRDLAGQIERNYGVKLSRVAALGISGMMHGYLVFDRNGQQLVPFRTWRNTMTGEAAARLTELFDFNIPQRWSIAHLYQAILNREGSVQDIAFMTTLAGYVHWRLSGEKLLGIGDASGMFPIDSETKQYHSEMLRRFDGLPEVKALGMTLHSLLPRVLDAGEAAGCLSEAGAQLLDPSGSLQAGITLCPPEGDAGTGMVATNSVAPRGGNLSAGTSIFAMIVLEKALSRVYPEIDLVTTPSGKPVAMVHCNNCSSDIDAWVGLFSEVSELFGLAPDKSELYGRLYKKALEAEADGGGLLAYNYLSGEHITGFNEGCPLLVRRPESRFNLANLMRSFLFSALSSLRVGMDILREKEQVRLEKLLAHGGLFKTEAVAQRLLSAALQVPVAVMASAGEGGAWGIALLAAFMLRKTPGESLEHYLEKKVFEMNKAAALNAGPEDIAGFEAFYQRYVKGLAIERAAVEQLS